MIRLFAPEDSADVVDVAVDSSLFAADEAPFVVQMMADYVAAKQAAGHVCFVEQVPGGTTRGVAYAEPAPATDGTWYLTMIAVRRAAQGSGVGGALMRHAEEHLRGLGGRLLLVETSGVPGFALTRRFYERCGYDAEARVRDYYTDGDDMVLFRKAL